VVTCRSVVVARAGRRSPGHDPAGLPGVGSVAGRIRSRDPSRSVRLVSHRRGRLARHTAEPAGAAAPGRCGGDRARDRPLDTLDVP